MDDKTQKYTPENDTGPMEPENPALKRTNETTRDNIRRGASESEFTQMAERKDEQIRYAIPDTNPGDMTIAGLAPQSPAQSPSQSTQPAKSTVPPTAQPRNAPAQNPYLQNQSYQQTSPLAMTQQFTPPPPPTAPMAPVAPVKRGRANILLIGGVLMLFTATLAFGAGVFVVLRVINSHPIDEVANVTVPVPTLVTQIAGVPVTSAPTPTVGLSIKPWDGNRRLTILFMGIDKRPNEKGTAFRTDSMMIVSIDPVTKSVGILSIPRDLFVDIPTDTVVQNPYGLQRVNAAYVIGELARPGYGPQLAMQTVQYNLGIRINNYVVYEFNTVINVIDTVGGVDVDVPYDIHDYTYPDMYFGYDPVFIAAGHQHLNGEMALKYARTRHQTSDFDRAKRQQQVLLAVRDKILTANMAPQLVLKAPELWDHLSSTTHTDLQFDQMVRIALYLKDIPKENIHQGIIDLDYVTGMNYNGQAILLPERAKLAPLLSKVFGANYDS